MTKHLQNMLKIIQMFDIINGERQNIKLAMFEFQMCQTMFAPCS